MLLRSTWMALVAFALACSELGPLAKKKDGDDSTTSAPPPDGTVEEPVLINLTAHCSSSTADSYVRSPQEADGLVACILKNDDGQRLAATDVAIAAVAAGGAPQTATPVAKATEAPWHTGFKIDPKLASKVESIVITFKTPEGEIKTITVTTADYDWSRDPLFQSFLASWDALQDLYSPPVKYDESKQIASNIGWLPYPIHVVFLSDVAFRGDFQLATADAYCAEAGAKLSPLYKYKALLSTPDADARARFPFKGTFVNTAGQFVSHIEGSEFLPKEPVFWEGDWIDGFRYTALGYDVLKRTSVVDGRRQFVTAAWTGTLAGGARDPAGTCNGWTSADPALSAQVIHAEQNEAPGSVFGRMTLPCSAYARIMCLGEGSLPPKP